MDTLFLADLLHALDYFGEIHRAKTELLAAGSDGGRDLVGFGGAQHENHPVRRLFQRLEQRVEGFAGDLMRFVDDEDLVAVARRAVAYVFPQFAHFVDAAIRGRVDLDHIRGISGRHFQAARAHAAGRNSWPLNAVEASRQDASHGGFSGAALAGKNVAVGNALLGDRVFEGGADVFLADQLRKRLRTVFPGDNLVHEGVSGDYARPRVIRGTRAKPLPLLPSGPGGVHSRPLHEARSLTTYHASMRGRLCYDPLVRQQACPIAVRLNSADLSTCGCSGSGCWDYEPEKAAT